MSRRYTISLLMIVGTEQLNRIANVETKKL